MTDETRLTARDPSFLTADPPHWVARGLAYVLLGLFTVSAAASILVRMPETVSGRFVLVPVRGTNPVRAGRKGVVARVRVSEGQMVPRTETLFIIRSEPAGDRFAELRSQQARRQAADERAANARRQYIAQQQSDDAAERALQSRLANLSRTIALKKNQYVLAESLATSYRQGLAAKAISPMEYSRPQLEADQLAVQIEEEEGQRAETAAALEKLRHERDGRRIEYDELRRSLAMDRQEAAIRIAPLEEELATTAGSELSVLAPCAGTVLRLRVNTPGAVVQDGDVLGEVACAGDRLVAEVAIPQSGLPLVRTGQGVKLRFDAFPYQRYGVKYGAIRWVGPASVSPGDSAAFRALVELGDTAVYVNGQPRPVLVGMGGRADVVVGRRTLLSYAFEPLRELRENFAEVPRR